MHLRKVLAHFLSATCFKSVVSCRLFVTDVEVETDLYVSYTFKLSPDSATHAQLAIGLFSSPNTQLWLVGDGDDDHFNLALPKESCLRCSQLQTVGTWTTRSVTYSQR